MRKLFAILALVVVLLSGCVIPTPQVIYSGEPVQSSGLTKNLEPEIAFTNDEWQNGRLWKYEDEDVICIYVKYSDYVQLRCAWKNLTCWDVVE